MQVTDIKRISERVIGLTFAGGGVTHFTECHLVDQRLGDKTTTVLQFPSSDFNRLIMTGEVDVFEIREAIRELERCEQSQQPSGS